MLLKSQVPLRYLVRCWF